MKSAYIYDHVRTPRGRGHSEKGALRGVKPVELLKTVFDALKIRNGLDTSQVDEVILGCNTVTGEQGSNIARIAPLYAGWDHRSNGVTVSSFCTSGLEAVQMAAMKIMTGCAGCAVAGGVESMSRIPLFSDSGSWFADEDVAARTGFIHMGLAADIVASLGKMSPDMLNRYSLRSHRLAGAAWEGIAYGNNVIPVIQNGTCLLDRDEGIRPDLSLEKLESLPRVSDAERQSVEMGRILRHIGSLEVVECLHSAGNAPGLADAASLLLMGDESLGWKIGREPLARLSQFASVSADPVIMLTGVVDATMRLLERSGLKISDIDLFEVNESFAAVPLMYMQKLGLPEDVVNVSGGAIAMGHPLGATGAILIGTLIGDLRLRGLKRGVAAICGGAGIAQATLVEVA